MSAAHPLPAEVGADQVWRELRHPPPQAGLRPLLCLDRDGVVVEEVDYLCRIADVRLLDGAATLIRHARASGWGVALLTNQAGIARGYFGWPEFAAVNRHIVAALAAQGAEIDLVIATPHHPQGRAPFAHPDHPMRKPNPGMLTAACALLRGDARRSLMVGDKADDLRAAQRAGLSQGFHVLSGHGPRERAAALALSGPGFAVHAIEHIGDPRLQAAIVAARPERWPAAPAH